MPRASTQIARPALRRLPTRPSRMVQAVVSRLLPLLFSSQSLELSHHDAAEALAEAFAAQQSGACNLLIAFRHPSTRDPVVMADLFWNVIPRSDRADFDRFAEMLLLVEEAIGWIEDKPGRVSPASEQNGWRCSSDEPCPCGLA